MRDSTPPIRPDAIPDPYVPENRARIRPPDGAETTINRMRIDPESGNATGFDLDPQES